MKELFPIGTAVRLRSQGELTFMIAGYLIRVENQGVKDYFAVPYPLGLLAPSTYICFNRDEISQVLHMGYCDAGCQKLLDGLGEFEQNLLTAVDKLKERDPDG